MGLLGAAGNQRLTETTVGGGQSAAGMGKIGGLKNRTPRKGGYD